MKSIILIQEKHGRKFVSARELYGFLGINTAFTHWCKRMFAYKFVEGEDFMPKMAESTGGRPQQDYDLTIDTAKEIAMLQNSDKGREIRQYFIACEKVAKEALASRYLNDINIKRLMEDVDLREDIRAMHREIGSAVTHSSGYMITVPELMKSLNMEFSHGAMRALDRHAAVYASNAKIKFEEGPGEFHYFPSDFLKQRLHKQIEIAL